MLFPPLKVLPVLSLPMTRWKSARLRGRALLLSARLPNGVRFLQHPMPAIPTALLAERPALFRRDVRLTMFESNDTDELVPAFSTGSRNVRVLRLLQSNRLHRHFWLEPVSVFGSLELTVAAAIHLCWTCHSADSQNRGDALSFEPPHGSLFSPKGRERCLGSFRPDRYQSRRCR